MQMDENSDLHPCAYFSRTFSSAQHNYNIYDQELRTVILALEEWRQYLQGTAHPITIITDHKNLSYIKDPRKLSRQQARWLLFLQDFDIQWQVTPGTKMAPADALSRHDHIDTSLDNQETPICPEPVIIQALDLVLAQKIRSSSESDPLVLQALESLKMGSSLFPHSSTNDWHVTNGHLYFKDRMYIPLHKRQAIVHFIHNSLTTGHVGQFHTKALLEQDFWWPGLSSFINAFIAGCAVCQQNKVNHHLTHPPLAPIPSSSLLSFKQLSVDLITDLPPSNRHDSLMVVVNHSLTKGVILIPCSKTIDATGVAKLFLHHVFKRFGLHDSLISDRGPQFMSAFTRELARLLQYDIKLSTTYHPQTDGQTKQTNQEVETYLRIFCANNPQKWTDFLPTTEFHHNSVPHSSTKVSPFSLLHRYEPRAYPPLGKTFLSALENHLTTLEEAWKQALAAHKMACQIMRERNTWNFFPWKVGDKVWLEATNFRLNYPSRKLAPKRQGPFEIAQVLSPLTYCLCLPSTWKIHDIFHASLLSSYRKTETHGPNFSKPPPDLIGTEEEYEVK